MLLRSTFKVLFIFKVLYRLTNYNPFNIPETEVFILYRWQKGRKDSKRLAPGDMGFKFKTGTPV